MDTLDSKVQIEAYQATGYADFSQKEKLDLKAVCKTYSTRD